MTRIAALSALLLASVTAVEAETQKFVQRAVLSMMGSIDSEAKWQEPLEKMLAQARERCAPSANDLLVLIEEVVLEENIETGIARREAVRAFLSSRTIGQGPVVVGTITVEQSNARRMLRGVTARANEREVEVEFACSPRQ